MNSSNLTSLGSNPNATIDNPYIGFATTVHAVGCWIATVYIGIVIVLITLTKTYRQYPGSALRWILYIEFASNLVYGPIKWWPKSMFHVPLAVSPGPIACYFTVLTDTFFVVGVLYSATICSYAFYALTANISFDSDGPDGRRKNCLALTGLWVLAGGLALLNISGGYHLDGWCQSSSKAFVGVKLCVVLCLFLAQVVFVIVGVSRLGRLERHLTKHSTEGGQIKEGCCNMTPKQQWFAFRFATILATQLVSWVPLAYIEFVSTFVGPPVLQLLYLASAGLFVGGIIDATVLLLNEDIKKWLLNRKGRTIAFTASIHVNVSNKVQDSSAIVQNGPAK